MPYSFDTTKMITEVVNYDAFNMNLQAVKREKGLKSLVHYVTAHGNMPTSKIPSKAQNKQTQQTSEGIIASIFNNILCCGGRHTPNL